MAFYTGKFFSMKPVYIVFAVILTSLYYFPFEFTFLPGMNTKMMMALSGGLIVAWRTVPQKALIASREFFVASLIATVFSLVGYYAVTYNNTNDYAYATYIVSMWVWAGGAYAVCSLIAQIHGYISVRLITNYLMAVCIVQCSLVLIIDAVPAVKEVVDTYIEQGAEFLNSVDRLYGIGAYLDVAGIRFAVVLVMIAFLLGNDDRVKTNKLYTISYVSSFVVISVIGNMIARTTTMGMTVAFIYLIYATGIWKLNIKVKNLKLWGRFCAVAFVLILAAAYLYYNNAQVREWLRFAFEGFFNWVETGRWETASTNKLMETMVVFPDNLKTWIIGDGYFNNPLNPNRFYMETDVGYLRFIFYCGLIGLSIFSIFFIYLAFACARKFPQQKQMFWMFLILSFVGWIKVSTDIFLIYALFLCMDRPNLRKEQLKKVVV
jgi:hypothetical protein